MDIITLLSGLSQCLDETSIKQLVQCQGNFDRLE